MADNIRDLIWKAAQTEFTTPEEYKDAIEDIADEAEELANG